MSLENFLLYLPLITVFVIAYPISMLEYGYRKFQSNYPLLFRISLPFHVYGFAHGVLAVFVYWVLWMKGFLPEGEVAAVLNPLGVGLGIKGITNLNFYSIVSTQGASTEKKTDAPMTPVGPKLIMDSIEKYSEAFIENSHDQYLDSYIHKSIDNCLKTLPSEKIITELIKHLPHSTKKIIRQAFKDEVEQSIRDSEGDLYFAMRLFVSQYGLSRYKRFINQIQ